MTQHYVVEIDTSTHFQPDSIDRLMDRLAPWHVALSETPLRTVHVTITIPAEDLFQAVATALAAASANGLAPSSVRALTEEERDSEPVPTDIPKLYSVTEVADLLGLTRPGVLARIDTGRLPAVRVGNAWVIPANSI